MTESRRVAKELTNLEAQKQAASKTTQAVARRTAILSVSISFSAGLSDTPKLTAVHFARSSGIQLRTQLTQAYEHSTLPDEELRKYLAKLQKDLVSVLGTALEHLE